jgi:hypothetical protein
MHQVARVQDTGRAPLGQQPAQPGGRVDDVLPVIRGGLAAVRVAGVVGLGAVLAAGAGEEPDLVAVAGQHAQAAA